MSLRHNGLLGGKETEKTLERTGNVILNRKQGIVLYSCSKKVGEECELGDAC